MGGINELHMARAVNVLANGCTDNSAQSYVCMLRRTGKPAQTESACYKEEFDLDVHTGKIYLVRKKK